MEMIPERHLSLALDPERFDFLEAVNEAVIILDADMQIQFWNSAAERIFEKRLRYVQGKKWESLLAKEDQLIEFNGAADEPQIIQIFTASGTQRDFKISINKLEYDGQKKHAYCVTVVDISPLMSMKREAEKLSRIKTDFMADLSHEARTSLLSILGYCDILKSHEQELYHNEAIQVIEDCAHQILGLVSNLIDISRIESQQITINKEEFSLYKMLEQCILSLYPRIDAKGLQIKTNLNKDVPDRIIGDENQIRQVLTNLVVNAIKFTDNGHIELKVELDNSTISIDPGMTAVRFSVSDTGVGVAAELRDSIFEPYSKAEGDNRETGAGLGLAISKKLIEAMGGLIWYETNNGRGSRFSFSIPLQVLDDSAVADRMNSPEVLEQSIQYECNMQSFRIMLVEDRKSNRQLVKLMLEKMGLEVHCAGNGKECLDMLPTVEPHIILMDMQMPIMDGYEATPKIRSLKEFSNIPIIALTAHAAPVDIQKCIDIGCNGYLSKPFNMQDLKLIILDKLRVPC